ncbi:hypothetical protein COB72_09310 [bacterium]|nr:MAG: hypothetical protein COB72_09310 [bacterium]
MSHTATELEAAVKQHTQLVRFLNGCAQSKTRNQPMRVSVKLNNKECVYNMPMGEAQSVVDTATAQMRLIEKNFGITAVVIGVAKNTGETPVPPKKEDLHKAAP